MYVCNRRPEPQSYKNRTLKKAVKYKGDIYLTDVKSKHNILSEEGRVIVEGKKSDLRKIEAKRYIEIIGGKAKKLISEEGSIVVRGATHIGYVKCGYNATIKATNYESEDSSSELIDSEDFSTDDEDFEVIESIKEDERLTLGTVDGAESSDVKIVGYKVNQLKVKSSLSATDCIIAKGSSLRGDLSFRRTRITDEWEYKINDRRKRAKKVRGLKVCIKMREGSMVHRIRVVYSREIRYVVEVEHTAPDVSKTHSIRISNRNSFGRGGYQYHDYSGLELNVDKPLPGWIANGHKNHHLLYTNGHAWFQTSPGVFEALDPKKPMKITMQELSKVVIPYMNRLGTAERSGALKFAVLDGKFEFKCNQLTCVKVPSVFEIKPPPKRILREVKYRKEEPVEGENHIDFTIDGGRVEKIIFENCIGSIHLKNGAEFTGVVELV